MPRFLACGDLHLDCGPDLGRAPGDRLREQEEVWRRCLEIAVEEDVDAVLFAGDAFHKARPSPEALLAFERPLIGFKGDARGFPFIAVLGNHDVAGVALGTGLEVFHEAGLLTLAREPAIHTVAGVSICCLPWAPVSRIVAAQDGGDRDDVNAYAAELLLATARGLRAQVEGPATLLTHFSISGSALPNGLPVEQLREPVLELGDLEALGFDAICAGHIHGPFVLGEGPAEADAVTGRCGFYVGSPVPLSFGEAGTEHGVWLLNTARWTARFIPIESRRLETLDIDPLAAIPMEWLTDSAWIGYRDVSDAIVKVRIHATQEEARRLDVAGLKRALYDAGAHKVWAVQLEIEKPERARVEGLSEELDELAALELWLKAEGIEDALASRGRERHAKYLEEIRS